jgi:hypothetical protein
VRSVLAALALRVVVGIVRLRVASADHGGGAGRLRGSIEPLHQGQPALPESPRTREQALLQDLGGEARGRPLLVVRPAQRLVERHAEIPHSELQRPLMGAEVQRRKSLDMAVGKARGLAQPRIASVDLALEPADDGLTDAAPVLLLELGLAGEAHRIEHLEQARERPGMAVVRSGGAE